MAHSNGVSLREFNKVTGQRTWRGEETRNGAGKRALRRQLRSALRQRLREDLRDGRI